MSGGQVEYFFALSQVIHLFSCIYVFMPAQRCKHFV